MDTISMRIASVAFFASLTLTLGLPHMDFSYQVHRTRHKRSTPQDHVNVVEGFLRELQSPQPKDVVFIMDRSSAVGNKNFYLQARKLLQTIIRQYLTIKPSESDIAVVTYAREARTVIEHPVQGSRLLKCDFLEKTDVLNQVAYESENNADSGASVRSAYRKAIDITEISRRNNPNKKQLVVVMTAAQFEDAEAPLVELGELYRIPVFGVAIGPDVKEDRMTQMTHYHANFSYWQKQTQSSKYHIATMKYPDFVSYPNGNCACGLNARCFCDVITGYSQCLCERGYTLNANKECVACPQGSFKSTIGNSECERCPFEAEPSRGPVAGGTDFHLTCYCFNPFYQDYRPCPDYCRTDPFSPISDPYCSNQRVCVRANSFGPGSQGHFTCACKPGYQGVYCNEHVQECTTQSCINGGQCLEGKTQFACVCPWGNVGKLCEKNEDLCSGVRNACSPGSTCHQRVIGEYVCVCDPGFTGPDCVHEDCLYKPCSPNGTIIEMKESPDVVSASSSSSSSAFSGATKMIVIIMPPAAAAIVIIVISVAALVHVRRKGARPKSAEKDASGVATETTSVVSRNPSLITFDSKCYQDEGTPAVPNLVANFYDIDDSVYGNEPLQKGMEEWYAYVLAIVHNNNLSRLTIVRLDGEKWVLSPGCRLSLSETKSAYNLLSNKVYSRVVTIQGRDFGIASNEDFVIVAHSVDDGQQQEIACAAKTRQFVITATAAFQGDNGRCRQEMVKLRDHIKQQGL